MEYLKTGPKEPRSTVLTEAEEAMIVVFRRHKRRNRIEITFGRLKDWRRVATRDDRCPKVFLSAITPAAVVIYWL